MSRGGGGVEKRNSAGSSPFFFSFSLLVVLKPDSSKQILTRCDDSRKLVESPLKLPNGCDRFDGKGIGWKLESGGAG